jgi:hypothetical protein
MAHPLHEAQAMNLEQHLSTAKPGDISAVLDDGTSRPMEGAVLVAVRFLPVTGDMALLFDCRQAMTGTADVVVIVATAVRLLEWRGDGILPHTHPVASASLAAERDETRLVLTSFDGARLSVAAAAYGLHMGSMPSLTAAPPDLTDPAALASFANMPSWSEHFVPLG